MHSDSIFSSIRLVKSVNLFSFSSFFLSRAKIVSVLGVDSLSGLPVDAASLVMVLKILTGEFMVLFLVLSESVIFSRTLMGELEVLAFFLIKV